MTGTNTLVFRDEPIHQSSSRVIYWFGLDHFEPERALTSHFVSSRTLFFIRLPLVLYSLVVMWVDIIYAAKTGGLRHFFAYFTDLTFIGLHAYLVTTAYHHAKYLWPHQSSKRPSSFLDQHCVLNYAYVYLYHTIIVYNIQTPVVFWALLAKEKLFDANLSPIDFWISISLHAVTLFILIVEVTFNRMILHINVILLVFSTVLLYMCLTFIIFAVEGWWVYSFLDWSVGPSAFIWYLAISVFIILCFFLQVLLHKSRDYIAKRIVKKYHNTKKQLNQSNADNEKNDKASEISQTSNFEPLESTVIAGSYFDEAS